MTIFTSSIRRQLLFLFSIIMLPVLVHLWYAGYAQRQQALNYAELQVDSSMRIFSDRQQLLVEKTRNLLAVLSRMPDVANGTDSNCSATLAAMHGSYPEYSTMVVANLDGIINCCSLPLPKPLNVKDRQWYQRALSTRQFVVGNFIISRSSGKASLPFAYPVFNKDGSLHAILGAALDLSNYDRFFQDSPLPQSSQILITDRNGTILYTAGLGSEPSGKNIASVQFLPPFDESADNSIITRLRHGEYFYWRRNITLENEPNAISLVVGIPQNTLFSESNTKQAIHFFALSALLILMAGFAWYYGSRLLITPIRLLVEQTRKISAGKLETDGPETQLTGEFRLLANSFTAMTGQLVQREKERNAAEQALRESEQRYRALFEQNPVSLWEEDLSVLKGYLDNLSESGVTDFHAYFEDNPEQIQKCLQMVTILHVNQATLTLYEAESEEDLLGSLNKIIPPSSEHLMKSELAAIAKGTPFAIEVENVTLGGRVFPALINSALPVGYERSWARVFVSVFDLTERYHIERQRKELERQLMLAQKMETVGTLAGGIAHDFNNILSPIIGYSELSLVGNDLTPVTRSHLTNILNAARRAKEMVHQILAFSRRQESSKALVSLTAITKEVLDLLRSSIPTTISIRAELAKGLRPIYGDGSRIHQVLMNLCTNSYHALKATGGTITVGVSDGPLQENSDPVRSKPHLLLFVEDNGPGIPYELQEKIFDPFFTTKGPGEGSGMGLAVVHGIIKDHGGIIELVSTPEQGTRFNIYLPCGEEDEQIEQQVSCELYPTGNERIMLIDDEESLVHMVREMLIKLGYNVSGYTSSLEALQAFRGASASVDLLLTDQTMPELTGVETAREMLAIRPDLPIILYTGYSETASPEQATQMGIRKFLYKPLSISQLAGAVREVLDTPA
ncbi:ATP-binding protein [Desulfopila aestuarii]|uniref:histidine kinase n=1 Tax=Desulfopila aestuarii DSM 18488 TaxID=1121416 RepID=A0A1M7YBP8_9BACT|nr:ATP-binding protein [Desulfopila aestuarii]SHO50011.1 Signal transduction histidine kinase [Desulfopila aestuarii DSM 18488]